VLQRGGRASEASDLFTEGSGGSPAKQKRERSSTRSRGRTSSGKRKSKSRRSVKLDEVTEKVKAKFAPHLRRQISPRRDAVDAALAAAKRSLDRSGARRQQSFEAEQSRYDERYARELGRRDRSWATVQATQRHFDRDNRRYLRAERREKGSPGRGRKTRKRRSELCQPSSSESHFSSEHESSSTEESAGPSWRPSRKETREHKTHRVVRREPRLKGNAATKHFRLMRESAIAIDAMMNGKKAVSASKRRVLLQTRWPVGRRSLRMERSAEGAWVARRCSPSQARWSEVGAHEGRFRREYAEVAAGADYADRNLGF
jgi:hypothetical protein